MKTLTRLLITLKSKILNFLRTTTPLKELPTQKIPKLRLHLAIAMSLFTSLVASTLNALKLRHADLERVDQASTLTAMDLRQEKPAETVA